MMIWILILHLSRTAISVVIYNDTEIVKDAAKLNPSEWKILAFPLSVQKIWLPYKEGNAFYGTNIECESQAYMNASKGWSFKPKNQSEALIYDDALYTERGECRLFVPSQVPMYLYQYGTKWGHELVYVEEGSSPTCPVNNTKFVGISKTAITGGQFTYSPAEVSGKSPYCLVSGRINTSCQQVPLQIQKKGKRLAITNESDVQGEYFWCSRLFNACGANTPLFEKIAGSFEYSTKKLTNEWNFVCWTWESRNC